MISTVVYDQLKFWLPMVSAFVLAYKGFRSIKKSIDGWAETLFRNHLSHIQDATIATVAATNETNKLLVQAATHAVETAKNVEAVKTELAFNRADLTDNIRTVRTDLKDHGDKEMAVWMGVVNTLSLLEDRSRRVTPKRTPRRRR